MAEIYYPLTKMNFIVEVTDVDGIAAFNEVSGVDASVDVIEFRQGNSGSLSPVKIQGLVKHGNVTLKMGYVKSTGIKDWISNCVSSTRGSTPRKDVTIELIDITEGAPDQPVDSANADGVAWTLKNALVCKYTGPDLNASTSEVAIESVEIAYEELVIPI